MKNTFLIAMVSVLALGCTQEPPPNLEPPATAAPVPAAASVPAPGDAPQASEVADAALALPPDAVRADPLATCEAGQVTTVRWNQAAVASGSIRIWIEAPTPALFAEAAEPGSKETGPWVSPGMALRVTDAGDRLLARFVVPSEVDCD